MTQPVEGSDAWANLHLMDTGQVLPLSSRNEFTMGRISEGQPIMPDIDLSPYQAYAAGVSRLHAVIKRSGSSVVFMDLGSANGTFLNGSRLAPNEEQSLHHGDIISLGKMRIQVLINK
jgi:pSer/pThr/pTyr-binding forkhead associated (FHA) protein